MLTTPLQLASAVSTLATRGDHFQPRIVKSLLMIQSNTFQLTINHIDYKPQTWETVINAMAGVINDPIGTGHRFGHPKYSVAKTGTAQVIANKKYLLMHTKNYKITHYSLREKSVNANLKSDCSYS